MTESMLPKTPRWGSWHCAIVALLTLVGFVALNLAGCGGGGSGISAPPLKATLNFQLRDATGVPVDGSVKLDNGAVVASKSTVATIAGVSPGTHSVTFTINGQASTASIVVGNEATQSFLLSLQTGASGPLKGASVAGRIILNPGDPNTFNCGPSSLGISAVVMVRVRDLNAAGQPIVSSYIKPDQTTLPAAQQGTYELFNIPVPGTYKVEVRQAPASSAAQSTAPFAGSSASFTVASSGITALQGIDVCANAGSIDPGGTPPPPPGTPNPGGTSIGSVTPTPLVTPTITPGPSPTPTATFTPGPTPTPTATNVPGATPTSTGPPVFGGLKASRRRR